MPQILGSNSKYIKVHNRALVLKYIQQYPMISRKEIAEKAGLTPAAITKIVTLLIDAGLVVEKDQDSFGISSGRRPIGLLMNKESYRILSVEAGRNSLAVGLFDLSGQILYREGIYEGILEIGFNQLTEVIDKLVKRVMKISNTNLKDLLGIGISAPGPINARKGTIIHSTDDDSSRYDAPYNWGHVHLTEFLSEEFGCPVFADNSGNISALAESWFGAGKGIDNFVQYTVGMGIGAGVIIDGLLYRGEDDVVSEIGHVTVDFNGPVCSCGNIGCLEIYGGFRNIISMYREKIGQTPFDLKASGNKALVEELEEIWKKAESNEVEALWVIKKIGETLGIGAVTLANIFSPEFIIVSTNDSGEIDPSLLTKPMESYLQRHAFSVIAEKVKIIPSQLGDNIHLYGGVALVLQDLLSNDPFMDLI